MRVAAIHVLKNELGAAGPESPALRPLFERTSTLPTDATGTRAVGGGMVEGGWSLQAMTQLSLDVAFPVVYGLFAAIAIAWLSACSSPGE